MARPKKPELNPTPNFEPVRRLVEAYIERCELAFDEGSDECLDLEDLDTHIAEAVLTAYCGGNVFDSYINKIGEE